MTSPLRRPALLAALVLVLAGTLLPAAPAAAATYAATLSTTTPVVTHGSDVTFTVVGTLDGVPAAGAEVRLMRALPDGTGEFIGWDVLDPAGTTTFLDYGLTAGATYWVEIGSTLDTVTQSLPVRVDVSYDIRPFSDEVYFDASIVQPIAIPPGGKLDLAGQVVPAGSTTPLLLEQRLDDGEWQVVGSVPVNADGTFRQPLGKRAQLGAWSFRLTHPAEGALVAGAVETTAHVTTSGTGRQRAWRPVAGTKKRPARWGTCRIGWRLDGRYMPASGRADLTEAMRRITQISGIRFRYLGKIRADLRRAHTQAGKNKMLVAWRPPRLTRGIIPSNMIAGVGGTARQGNQHVSGFLLMNANYSKNASPGFGDGFPLGLVLMHELGHVVGLDHANDEKQVMAFGAALPAAVWGAADIAGLKKLGSRCR
jgi:hypothetical protein